MRKICAVIVFLVHQNGHERAFCTFLSSRKQFYCTPSNWSKLPFLLIQMSGYSDFSYQGSMLENSTKDHHFLVLLIASKDPSKNAYSALFKQKGAKSCIMKSGKNSQILINLSKVSYFFAEFFKIYSNINNLKDL